MKTKEATTGSNRERRPAAAPSQARKKWPSPAKQRAAERTDGIQELLKMFAAVGDLDKKPRQLTCEMMDAIHHAINSSTSFRDQFLDQLNLAEQEGLTDCGWEHYLAGLLAEWINCNPEIATAMKLDRKTRLGMVEQVILFPRDVWATYLAANRVNGRPRNIELDLAHILKEHAVKELARFGKGQHAGASPT